jgi:1-acyl-sn-glycerol-3-phosphate acyltransferase
MRETDAVDAYRAFYPIGKILLKVVFTLFGGFRVEGAENVPRTGGVILAPNHRSDCDPAAVAGGSLRPLWFVAKEELFHVPILAPTMRFFHAIPIKRDTADRSAIRRIEELLGLGEAVVIFPEGRVSPTGGFQPLEPGVALIALRAGKPIVPVGLLGTERIIPYGAVIPRPAFHVTTVRFGAPITFDDIAQNVRRREQVDALMARLEEEMKRLVEG